VRYRKSSENALADALLRKKCVVIAVDLKCPWYPGKYQEVSDNPDIDANYQIAYNRLFKKVFTFLDNEWKVCVPLDESARMLQETHDAPTEHLSTYKTIAQLAQHYYCSGMRKDAASHVRNCHGCQVAKAL
jgi:hypothetical protein